MTALARLSAHSLFALAVVATAGPAVAVPEGAYYSCIDSRGRKLTSDRPIIECLDREQRVLNRDGSQRQVLPPSMTADERAALEEAKHRASLEQAAKQDAIRRDRNLLSRFRDEPSHQKAREGALDVLKKAIASSERRLAEMRAERKPLLDEAEFYKGKKMPDSLRTKMDYVDVTIEAQEQLVLNQRAEESRINDLYDIELAHLRKLWGGAPVGSLGALPEDVTKYRR